MKAAEGVTEEIKDLLSREEYSKALKVVEERGVNAANDPSSSSLHKELLLLISRTYYFNKKYKESKDYLARFESHYSDSTDKIDYIIQKWRWFLLEDKAVKAIELLNKSLEKERPEKEYYELNFYLGQAHFWNGDYSEANHLLEKCYRYYLNNSDHYMLGLTLYMFGYVAFRKGSLDDAENYFNKALRNLKISRKNHQIGHTYKMFSIVNYRSGRYNAAKETIDLSEGYFKKCSSKSNILNCRIVRARILMFESDYSIAEELLLGAYDEGGRLNFKRVRALSAEFLGEIYCRRGDYEKALSYLKEALQLALDTAPRGDVAVDVYRRLGDVYIALERTEEAEEMLSNALTLCRRLGDEYELGCVYRAYALLAIGKNDIDLARSYFKKSIFTLRPLNESFELASTYAAAAGEYMVWSAREGIKDKLKRELLEDVLDFAVEATHLYQSINLVERAKGCEEIIREIEKLSGKEIKATPTKKLTFNSEWLHGGILVARSKETRKVVSRMEEIAGNNISVLITGETGTGKEVAARFIHKTSDRADAPFVAVNCAAIQDSVFESELFGHTKGAFTGASRDRTGLIERADGGTLFLDEITELSNRNQAKLLRVLEDGKIRRLGDSDEKEIDIRLVSATNKPAKGLCDSGKLRKDLYFRIAAELLILEPLRNRKEDIEALFAYYLQENGNGNMIEPDALSLLMQHQWPGNTRELVNLVKSIGIVAGKRAIRVGDLPREIRNSLFSETVVATTYNNGDIKDVNPSKNSRLAKKRELLLSCLERNFGNKAAAARELGISRKTLYKYLNNLNIDEF